MIEHSKYYYKKNRNMLYKENEEDCGCGETMALLPLVDQKIPEYYKGKYGYEARFVIDNFDLNYHIGTAVSYLLRSYRKHEAPIECIKKAIAHLEFEIERYERENN